MNKRFKIVIDTLGIVIAILILKVVVQFLGWEVLSITSLHTGLMAGSVFVLGFILSGTHADYKESEKMPIEITTALESIYQDGVACKKQYGSFNLSGLTNSIRGILTNISHDIHHHANAAFDHAKDLGTYITEMETLGFPANYIVKLKTEQNTIIRIILRMRYLQRIQPLPSAFTLVQAIVFIIITMLLFTKIGKLIDEVAVMGFLAFTYIYILKLIKVMDTPFHPEGSTLDDISLFLLEEQFQRIEDSSSTNL